MLVRLVIYVQAADSIVFNFARISAVRCDPAFTYAAIFPGEIHLKIPSCLDSIYGASVPSRRKGSQGFNIIALALQQHFRDTSCRAKVSIDLVRWMGIKQIGKCRASELFTQKLSRAVSILHSRPHIYFPRLTPAGSTITAFLQRNPDRLQHFIIPLRSSSCHISAGMKNRNMVLMPVIIRIRHLQSRLIFPLCQLSAETVCLRHI